MHHLSASVLILGLGRDFAAAQQPNTAAESRGFVVAPRARGSAKREAEQRPRRVRSTSRSSEARALDVEPRDVPMVPSRLRCRESATSSDGV
jgi:hypothetical protein